ncbi:S9 family peptidase [Nevskia sp.]|uniref:alpha/beta hydrolase family protein n=1 Tax=Nevskia sp. TaxID=1929292 RepID=UPI0025F06331|nr:S9 family peptidase [Nevskia sp.]
MQGRTMAGSGALGTLLLALLLPATAHANPASEPVSGAEPIPIEAFVRPKAFHSPQLSPDGRHIALVVPSAYQSALAMLKVADSQQVGHLQLPPGNHIVDFDWIGDRQLLVSLGVQYAADEPPAATGELAVVDVDGKNFKVIYGSAGIRNTRGARALRKQFNYGNAFLVDPLFDDPEHVAIQTRKWAGAEWQPDLVMRLNVKTSVLTEVARSPEPGSRTRFLLDGDGRVRYAVTSRSTFKSRTWQRADGGKDWKPLEIEGEHPPKPLVFSGDGRSVFEEAYDFGPTSCLVEHVLESGERRALACDPESDLFDVYRSFDRSRTPIAAVFSAGRPEVRFLDKAHPHRVLLQELLAAFPGKQVVPASVSRDGSLALLYVYDDRSPGDYYLFHPATKKADYFAAVGEWLDPDRMNERRPFRLKARDGTTLWGYLTLPRDKPAKALPLVVNPHGGPYKLRDDWAFDHEAQLLASRGYAVLQVNFRGSGGYGNGFVDAGKKAWGTTMIDDITDAVRWSIGQGFVDERRICIYGSSYGGYASVMSAAREPDLYRCVIAAAGVYDLSLLKKESDIADTKPGLEYLDEAIGNTREEQIAQSPVNHLDRLKAPVFIIHGKEDERTPVSQAKALRAGLIKRGHPHEWLVKDGEGHGFADTANQIEQYTKIFAFLEQYIGAASTSPSAIAAVSGAQLP